MSVGAGMLIQPLELILLVYRLVLIDEGVGARLKFGLINLRAQ